MELLPSARLPPLCLVSLLAIGLTASHAGSSARHQYLMSYGQYRVPRPMGDANLPFHMTNQSHSLSTMGSNPVQQSDPQQVQLSSHTVSNSTSPATMGVSMEGLTLAAPIAGPTSLDKAALLDAEYGPYNESALREVMDGHQYVYNGVRRGPEHVTAALVYITVVCRLIEKTVLLFRRHW